jgi:hypothetical protein
MRTRAMEGTCLATLVRMAVPLCQAAEQECPRRGPGRPPQYPDGVLALLIMVAILKKKKSKSAQYLFLHQHHQDLQSWLGLVGFPARSTYFERYRRAYRLFEVAIRLQGEQALREGVTDAHTVAVDKSLIAARGPVWPQGARREGRIVRGADREAAWGYSEHHGWVYGYSYEVVVSAVPGTLVFPLLASAGTASRSEGISFGSQIGHLPPQTINVLADRGYDKNEYGDRLEYDSQGRPTGRHFLCPPVNRHRPARRRGPPCLQNRQVRLARQRRERRIAFYRSPRGRRWYARRTRTVEPFNEWLKNLFDLHEGAWHRGLANTCTQLLAAVFAYQLLLRLNGRLHFPNGQIKWLIDTL